MFMSDFMRNSPTELGKDLSIHLSSGTYPIYIRGDLGRFLPHKLTSNPRVHAFLDCPHSLAGPPEMDPRGKNSHLNQIDGCSFTTQEWHLPSYCKAGGSMSVALQHAAMEYGVEKIILIGVHGVYSPVEQENHLWPDYLPPEADRTPEQAHLDSENIRYMHETAARECARLGIRIVNCSPNTLIKAHDVGDLADELQLRMDFQHPPFP